MDGADDSHEDSLIQFSPSSLESVECKQSKGIKLVFLFIIQPKKLLKSVLNIKVQILIIAV